MANGLTVAQAQLLPDLLEPLGLSTSPTLGLRLPPTTFTLVSPNCAKVPPLA